MLICHNRDGAYEETVRQNLDKIIHFLNYDEENRNAPGIRLTPDVRVELKFAKSTEQAKQATEEQPTALILLDHSLSIDQQIEIAQLPSAKKSNLMDIVDDQDINFVLKERPGNFTKGFITDGMLTDEGVDIQDRFDAIALPITGNVMRYHFSQNDRGIV